MTREIVRRPFHYRPEREGHTFPLVRTGPAQGDRTVELVGGEMVIREAFA